ncbi:hypothetical protein CYMTET_41297 [Cymbomonas tetramitiformis]|uniref:Protein TIC 20 n=1 Tax=Cymbomonas tetramitiformis TaxID=36881 RepID=A0AAE0C8J1_9CHLO|nr:hypothetical protein CYMTET_41297 [Cymbomonas tetramitiformis]
MATSTISSSTILRNAAVTRAAFRHPPKVLTRAVIASKHTRVCRKAINTKTSSYQQRAHLSKIDMFQVARGQSPGNTRRNCPTTCGYYTPSSTDRLIAAVPYLLPFFESLRYGTFFFQQFPISYSILAPLMPLIQLFQTIPFAPLVIFFVIYLGIVKNASFSWFVRFNAFQAIMLDVCLILPSVVESIFRAPRYGVGLTVYQCLYTTVFLYVAGCFFYAVLSCVAGKAPMIKPLIGEAAAQQV